MTDNPEVTDYLLSGPPFECVFSAVDQVTPPIYSRRVLIFSRQDDDPTEATHALKRGLQRTIDEFPPLAGQMGYSPTGWTVKNGQARLRIKAVDMDFAELARSRFDEAMLAADLISSVPTLADPETEWHACRIQANFIREGLLLVISINHTTMDGFGITKVVQALARNCGAQETPTAIKHDGLDRSSLNKCGNGEGAVSKLDAYSIVQGTPNLGPVSSKIITTSFRFQPEALRRLKEAASPGNGWVSTHDAVNALCFRTHARGRFKLDMISHDDIARFAFPVDFRKLTSQSLPSDYVGNAVLMTKVEVPTKTLLGPGGLSQAADAIRNGVKRVNADYVDNFISVARSLERPGQMKINMKLNNRNTAFGSTSYKSFDHANLDWPPVLGKFDKMRLCSGVTGEGMSIIMPVLEDGSWEVTVSFEEELEELFRQDEELLKYAS